MLSYALCLWLLIPATMTPPRNQPPAQRTLRLGPMLFHVQGGKVKTIEQLELKELFRVASRHYQEKKYTTAIQLYQRIIQYFPKHKHRYAALYNLALALEDAGQLKQAIVRYQQLIQENPKRKENILNAQFRIAACYNQLRLWSMAFEVYGTLLQTNLALSDRVDALAYAGRALFHMRKYDEALPLLRLAVLTHTQQPTPSISYSAAMAQYYRGFTFDQMFRERKFHLPQFRLKQDLDYKSENMLKAQKMYFQTIRLRHANWALAALYRIGEMYERMYHDMINAPVPKDLNKEEVGIYQSLLRKRIKILLAKALLAYRMNLRLAASIGLKSHRWKSRSDKRFQELLAFYRKWFGKSPDELQAPAVRGSSPGVVAPTSRPAVPGTSAPTSKPVGLAAPASRPVLRNPVQRAPASRPTIPQPRTPRPALRQPTTPSPHR